MLKFDWMNLTFIPIPIKGDQHGCNSYRTMAIVSQASKVLLKVILSTMQKKMNADLATEQEDVSYLEVAQSTSAFN